MNAQGGEGLITILIVEDEKSISNLIRLSLRKAGYAAVQAFDGKQAADLVTNEVYDLILLDVNLPGIDGFELLEYVRPLEIPVIFLTARNALEDRVRGLRMGAEDYIVKPFEVAELLARVDVVLRRYHKSEETLSLAGVTVDTRSHLVTKDGVEIALTPREYEVLLLFLRTPNTALYRDTIYERVWGGDMEYGSKTVDLHVQRLRKKIGWEDCLKAVHKIGYRLEVKA